MKARVRVGNSMSEPFGVSRGVKQGCVLAPVLFNLYISYVTELLPVRVGVECGIHLNYRLERSLFDLQKLKARNKIWGSWFLELQYADDCGVQYADDFLNFSMPNYNIAAATELYAKFGLEINIQKTEVLCKAEDDPVMDQLDIVLNGAQLKTVNSFKYLGSCITNDYKLDTKINSRICQDGRSFGRLQTRVLVLRFVTYRIVAYCIDKLNLVMWVNILTHLVL